MKILTDEKLKEKLTEEMFTEYCTLRDKCTEEEKECILDYMLYAEKTPHLLNLTLKQLREKNNLTQEEVAKVLKISRREYWRLEQIGYNMSIKKVKDLAIFYNVSIDYMVSRETMKPFYPEIEKTYVNGYNLQDMLEAKAKGQKYTPKEAN